MRGHEQIIAVRKAGLKPAGLVHLDDYPVNPLFLDWLKNESMPTVTVYGDELATLDLRFLVGLMVSITGDDLARVKALSVMARKAGADMVVASVGEKFALWKKGDAAWQSF